MLFRSSGNPATFEDGYDAANVKKLTVTITPTQSGSGDPSPSNVRPISGVSSVSVTRTGENVKNLWGGEKMLSDIQSAAPNATISGTTINFSAASVSNKRLDSVSFRENTRYTFILKEWLLAQCCYQALRFTVKITVA